jgi:hypothetical protein
MDPEDDEGVRLGISGVFDPFLLGSLLGALFVDFSPVLADAIGLSFAVISVT